MKYYNIFRAVPQEAQKKIEAGKLKGFTDINPMWRIKVLTETFGANGWYTDQVKMWREDCAGETAAFVSLNLYVKMDGEWSHPFFGIGGSKLAGKGVGDGINDEAYKMAYTDALGIACKNLGMAADIYFDKDRTKYNSVVESEAKPTPKTAPKTAPKSAYKPVSEEFYWQYVKAYAEGRLTKSGGDCKQTWINHTHAGDQEILKFDNDVANLKASL